MRLSFFLAALTTTLPHISEANTNKPSAPRSIIIEAFTDNATTLTPNFKGTNPISFLRVAEDKFKLVERGEFDTDADVLARKRELMANMAPLRSDANYAFRMDLLSSSNLNFKYDTSVMAFKPPSSYGLLCGSEQKRYGSPEYDAPSKYNVCSVIDVEANESTYVGSNAYGASREIFRRREKEFALAIPKSNELFQRFQRRFNSMEEVIAIPVDKAKSIGSNNIGTIFVGNIVSPEIVEGESVAIRPTIDNPNDFRLMRMAVPFNLKKVVYFVKSTGEIIGIRE